MMLCSVVLMLLLLACLVVDVCFVVVVVDVVDSSFDYVVCRATDIFVVVAVDCVDGVGVVVVGSVVYEITDIGC